MTDISLLAEVAYATGIDPVTYAAEHVIQAHVDAYLAGLGLPPDPGTAALSCRVVGELMDSGWTAPEVAP